MYNYRNEYFEETELVFELEANDDGAQTADCHVNIEQIQNQSLGKLRVFAEEADLRRLMFKYRF